MPAVLTHKAIMLLARERLADIRNRLQDKVNTGGTVTDLEHRVLYLATKAHEMMSDNVSAEPSIDFPTSQAHPEGLGRGVSKFAVMGAMGPDITGFSALLAPGQGWVFDTIHKGTPDENREPLVARTTDFTLEFWRRLSSAIDARGGTDAAAVAAKERARAQMRAYAMGHLCHIAGDVISHPFINDIEWHVGTASRVKFSHSGGEGSIDAKVAQQVLRRASTREGQQWSAWWPTVDEVPAEFFTTYDLALEQIYSARSARPTGFGGFEEEFAALKPPPLSVDFIKDGYAAYRHGVLGMGYGWGYWSWWGFLLPAMLPLMALFPLVIALPAGRSFLEAPVGQAGERAFFEVAMLPMAMSSLIPAFYGIWIAAITSKGVETLTGLGITSAILSLIAAITFFATLGVDDLPWWFRWLILFGLPAALGLAFSGTALANLDAGKSRRRTLALIYASPLIITALFLALFFLALGISGGDSPTGAKIAFGIIGGLAVVGVGVAWFLLAKKARDARVPERAEPFPAERPHFVRLFDDTTLFHDPAVAPTLATRFFPSARRKLLKLWWEGAGDLYVRSRRSQIEFSFTGEGAAIQTVSSPIAPMTPAELAQFLTRTVRDDGASTTGHLKAAVVYPTDLEYELPPGATFSDEGDADDDQTPVEERPPDESAIQKHDRLADQYKKLGKSQDDTDYILYHAPKAVQAIRFGRHGPVPSDPRADDSVDGVGHIESSGIQVRGDGTFFRTLFAPGDQIRAATQVRLVTLVKSDTELVTASAFNPALPAGTSFERLGPEREPTEGYTYVANPDTRDGQTIMDYAADVASLLCLGATPHLLKTSELSVASLAGKVDTAGAPVDQNVTKIYQVFRNWSLDRRRLNEWRMLVAGGALSEKGEVTDSYDSAMTRPRDPAWTLRVPQGEQVAHEQGWVAVLRQWLTMAAKQGENAANPNGTGAGDDTPKNLDLSRAMAFLLDMPDPVTVQ